jgi:UDP-GlcNAc:undecaprenyl-phosphate GlcNAc-1-phosphate transferase
MLTPLVAKFASKMKLVDDPKKHKHPAIIHKTTLPRAGGLPIYVAILISILVLLPGQDIFIPILAAGGLVVLIGLLDDKYDISAEI